MLSENNNRKRIFVHSSFRVSSTWLWIKFRNLSETTAYYEVFHERLASITKEQIVAFNTTCWDSKHPLTEPYFDEYTSLLKENGGVIGFDKTMAFQDYIPKNGIHSKLSSGERFYVNGLIVHAERSGTIPVLTCGRTLGRIGSLRRSFGGCHILLIRSLVNQWRSYLRLTNNGVYYFQNATLQTIVNGSQDPFLNMLANECVEKISCNNGLTIVRFLSLQTFLKAFLWSHIYLYACALPFVDQVINVSECARSEQYRVHIEEALYAKTGLKIILDDAIDLPAEFSGLQGDFQEALEGLAEFLSMHIGSASGEAAMKLVGELLAGLDGESPR